MSVESDTLARIDQGDKDHERDLADVRALWEREDAATKANRDKVLAAYDQGAKDRAEARERAKEALDPPVNARFTRAEIARLQALLDKEEARQAHGQVAGDVAKRPEPDVAPRMSSLPAVSWSTPEEPPKDRPSRPTPQMSDAAANQGVPADPVRPRMSSLPAEQYPGTAAANPIPAAPQLPQRMSSLPPVNWSTPEEANRPDPTKPALTSQTWGVGEEPPKT